MIVLQIKMVTDIKIILYRDSIVLYMNSCKAKQPEFQGSTVNTIYVSLFATLILTEPM